MPTLVAPRTIPVAMGQLVISGDADVRLVAHGLGSCVGVAAYDPLKRLGGLLHVLLPSDPHPREPLGRYADVGVRLLLEALERAGGRPERLIIRLAGGASVLAPSTHRDRFNIGERNVAAVRAALAARGLTAAAADVGGTVGRTIELTVADGRLLVKVAGRPAREL